MARKTLDGNKEGKIGVIIFRLNDTEESYAEDGEGLRIEVLDFFSEFRFSFCTGNLIWTCFLASPVFSGIALACEVLCKNNSWGLNKCLPGVRVSAFPDGDTSYAPL